LEKDMTINWYPVQKLRSVLKNPYFNLLASAGMIFSAAHELVDGYESFEHGLSSFSIMHGAFLFGIYHFVIAVSDIWEALELFEKAEEPPLEKN
jgi:hypothetical protein